MSQLLAYPPVRRKVRDISTSFGRTLNMKHGKFSFQMGNHAGKDHLGGLPLGRHPAPLSPRRAEPPPDSAGACQILRGCFLRSLLGGFWFYVSISIAKTYICLLLKATSNYFGKEVRDIWSVNNIIQISPQETSEERMPFSLTTSLLYTNAVKSWLWTVKVVCMSPVNWKRLLRLLWEQS